MRLDKFMAQAGAGTRSQVKEYIRKGNVAVNGSVVKRPELAVNELTDNIQLFGEKLCFKQYHYYMLNKPAGVVTATKDNHEMTVMDLMRTAQGRDLFPVGRLDKDTVGLLIITDDGELSHRLLSPKRHVEKTYYVEYEGELFPDAAERLARGVDIGDAAPTLPARVCMTASCSLELSITEGRYHQVKRMIQAVGGKVTYLKRTAFGGLCLDESLPEGAWRELSEEETTQLKAH